MKNKNKTPAGISTNIALNIWINVERLNTESCDYNHSVSCPSCESSLILLSNVL